MHQDDPTMQSDPGLHPTATAAAGEHGQTALQRFERTAHMRCCDCGRFVPKEYRVTPLAEQRKDPNANIVRPVCAECRQEYDPPEW